MTDAPRVPPADGINLLHPTGAAALQSVFHLHVRVPLRFVDDAVALPEQFLQRKPDELDMLAERLRPAG